MATSGQTQLQPPRERVGYEITYGSARERVGYNVNYITPRCVKGVDIEPLWKRPATEANIGLLVFGGGAIWATQVETIQFSNIVHLLLTPGPLEISAIGLLVWLHAKWRRSVRVR
ncbi:MAG TPA: hypothetical protein VN577_09905 [Terriglobales bacterium]|nr:hypothetical protein [Terriglobales bacterium]